MKLTLLLILIVVAAAGFSAYSQQPENTVDKVKNATGALRIIYFTASYCPACKQNAPIIEQLKVLLGNTPIETGTGEIARMFKIKYIPTLIIIDSQNTLLYQKTGVASLEEYVNAVKKAGINLQ